LNNLADIKSAGVLHFASELRGYLFPTILDDLHSSPYHVRYPEGLNVLEYIRHVKKFADFLDTTALYTRVAISALGQVTSPLDFLLKGKCFS
jgi:hypothetical protein